MSGSIVYELAPKKGNPRNSEGSFCRCPDGRLLFVYSAFYGGAADDASADLAALSSTDEGLSWKEDGILFRAADENAMNLMSVSLLETAPETLGLFYLTRHSDLEMQLYMRSSGDGRTWSEAVLCTPLSGYHVINNDRVLRLRSGRLLAPVAAHRKNVRPGSNDVIFESASDVLYYYSDDQGRTWLAGSKSSLPHLTYSRSGLQEPGAIELSSGVLWGWARTDLGRQYEMYSMDGGISWTAPQPSRFTSPNSPLSMKRLPDGRLIAVWNPIPIYNGRSEYAGGCWTGGRSPLVYALSEDDGRTFTEPRILEDEKDRGYCYTAIYPCKEHLLLAYCAGGPADGVCLARLRLRVLPYNEL